jgi:hypothetical protein
LHNAKGWLTQLGKETILFSSRTRANGRRSLFLRLSAHIERQLREAYDRKFRAKEATQSSLAEKLGINRSAIHRRLTGRTNMRLDTLADMVWALDHEIDVCIYDPRKQAESGLSVSSVPSAGSDDTNMSLKGIRDSSPQSEPVDQNSPLMAA